VKKSTRLPLRDLIAFGKHIGERKKIFRSSSAEELPEGAMNRLAETLHPGAQKLQIASVRQENEKTWTYRLVPADPNGRVAFFRAGQYITIEESVAGNRVSRPYSLSSPPDDSREGNYYEITIRENPDGYVSPFLIRHWKEGRILTCSGPEGCFCYDSLRDSREMICLAGGSGITPFRSLIPDTLSHEAEVRILLIYGFNTPDDFLFREEFHRLTEQYPRRFRIQPVCAVPDRTWKGETGFITPELIEGNRKAMEDPGFFICGPEGMHEFLNRELERFGLPRRRIRRENYGLTAPAAVREKIDGSRLKTYVTIRIKVAETETAVKADTSETVLTALERAGLNPPARCRSGECGWCRSRLLSGQVSVNNTNDGRRAADLKFGYIHPCSSYPLTDLEIINPVNPLQIEEE